jgi:hypothetical protein
MLVEKHHSALLAHVLHAPSILTTQSAQTPSRTVGITQVFSTSLFRLLRCAPHQLCQRQHPHCRPHMCRRFCGHGLETCTWVCPQSRCSCTTSLAWTLWRRPRMGCLMLCLRPRMIQMPHSPHLTTTRSLSCLTPLPTGTAAHALSCKVSTPLRRLEMLFATLASWEDRAP